MGTGDIAAIGLCLGAVALMALAGQRRKDMRLTICLLVVFVIYEIFGLAIVNLFPGMLDNDAIRFQDNATEWAANGHWEFALSAKMWDQLLGFAYRTFGVSSFLGAQISIFAILLACVVLYDFAILLNVKYRISMIFLFALLPSMLIRCSNTMREPWLILFFMLGVYYGLKAVMELRIRYFAISLISIIITAALHKTFLIYAIFLVAYLFFYLNIRRARGTKSDAKIRLCYVVMSLGFALVGGVALLASEKAPVGAQLLQTVVSGDTAGAEDYLARHAAIDARTTYSYHVEFSSISNFFTSLPMPVIYYFFAPFPWMISAAIDVYGVLEVFFRTALIAAGFIFWRQQRRLGKGLLPGVLLLIYFALAILWATGTVSYGTASRHHLTHQWLILLLGWPALAAIVHRFVSPATRRRSRPSSRVAESQTQSL